MDAMTTPSSTPRTDEFYRTFIPGGHEDRQGPGDFARELERELIRVTAERDEADRRAGAAERKVANLESRKQERHRLEEEFLQERNLGACNLATAVDLLRGEIKQVKDERDSLASQLKESLEQLGKANFKLETIRPGPDHMCPAIDAIIWYVQNAQETRLVSELTKLVAEDGTGLLADLRRQIMRLRAALNLAFTDQGQIRLQLTAALAQNERLRAALRDAREYVAGVDCYCPTIGSNCERCRSLEAIDAALSEQEPKEA